MYDPMNGRRGEVVIAGHYFPCEVVIGGDPMKVALDAWPDEPLWIDSRLVRLYPEDVK